MNKQLANLIKQLKRKSSIEGRKVHEDSSHYQGMCKGMSIAYCESARKIEEIMKKHSPTLDK